MKGSVHQDEHNETNVGVNSNLTIPDFPHNNPIRIRLVQLKKLLHPDVALSLPHCLSQFRKAKLRQPTGHSNVRMQQKHFAIQPILFLYYKESLGSSNLNSKLFRFHCVRPNVYIFDIYFYQVPPFCETFCWHGNHVVI